MTAAYMTRCVYLTFFGEYRGHHHPHESPKAITIPLIILAIFSIFAGFLQAVPFHIEKFKEWVEPKGNFPYENLVPEGGAYILHADFSIPKAIVASVMTLVGFSIAYLYYWKKIGAVGLTEKSKLAHAFHTLLVNKYYLDVLYTDIIVAGTKKQIANACYWINQNVIDGTVNLVGKLTVKLGDVTYTHVDQSGVDGVVNSFSTAANSGGAEMTKIQSGKIRLYAATLFAATIVLALITVYVQK
jgi:NADH-quinone oxidoreductase subunit L